MLVFVDDDPARKDVNKRAVCYSIYENGAWSAPDFIDNDGTLDDYPNLDDLGDGRILVTWSSADNALPEGATVEAAFVPGFG